LRSERLKSLAAYYLATKKASEKEVVPKSELHSKSWTKNFWSAVHFFGFVFVAPFVVAGIEYFQAFLG